MKVLDFGLAKARLEVAVHDPRGVRLGQTVRNLDRILQGFRRLQPIAANHSVEHLALTEAEVRPEDSTRTMQQSTELGVIVGTASYMSPEQAEGKKVDARSDIFSFGSLLYEMLTGRPVFGRETSAATLAAILHMEPPPLPAGTPPELERIIARCLRKDPAHRFQHMDDLKVAIEELKEESDSGKPAVAPAAPGRHRIARSALAAAVLVLLAAAGVLFWRRIHGATLTDKDMLVLGDFRNTTGDSVFDDTLKQGLAVQFGQSPFLSLVSDRTVNETLKLMGRPPGDRLTPEVAREVCQRTISKAMLTGYIVPLGAQYVLGLKAVECNSGDVLAEAQEQAPAKEAVLKALDAAAVRLRSKLGESLSTVRKFGTPLEQATTSSLDALTIEGW